MLHMQTPRSEVGRIVLVGVRHHNFIIPAGARCCPNHLQQNIENLNPLSDSTLFNKSGITELVKFLRNVVLKKERTRLDFDSRGNLAQQITKVCLEFQKQPLRTY